MEQPSNKIYRVNRTSGAASTDGVDYENYLFLQVLLRLLEDDTIEEFYIAQNVNDVLPFDDIVIRVKYNLPGSSEPVSVTKLFFVQMKYIQSRGISLEALTATKGKGTFQLQKYFKGYLYLLKRIQECQIKDEILQECKPEDMTFIILTNAPCPLGDDNYSRDNLCRKLLETNTGESNVFQFDSSERYKDFYQQLKINKNPIDQDEEGKKFMEQLVLFAGGSKTAAIKESVKEKLKFYFSGEDINLEDVLQRAIRFITKESSCWLSRYSGALFNVIFKYQGIPVKLTDIVKHWNYMSTKEEEEEERPLYNIKWKNNKLQFMNKIIVQHMCLDETIKYVSVGKPMKEPESYYVDRIPRKYDRPFDSFYKQYEISETNESVVLLCGGPGMGKSSFFTYQANLLKRRNPEKFIVRIDLIDFSSFLHELEVNKDSRDTTVEFLLKISEIAPNTAEYDLFYICLRRSRAMVFFLDGVDEVSPLYYNKLFDIIRIIRWEFYIQIWISTRPIVQKNLENDLEIQAWILEEFLSFEAMKFIEIYCGAAGVNIFRRLEIDLKGIPIFCKMLGDVIKNNQKENLNDVTNKAELYDKFVDTMYEVYNKEKKKHDVSNIATKRDLEKLKKISMEDHEKASLLEVLLVEDLRELKLDVRNECKEFLKDISAGEEKAGLIVNIVDGRPRFIHRTIAEYFCGRLFSKNLDKLHEYVKKFKLSSEVDYHSSCKLNGLHELFKFILMRKEDEINKYLENLVGELNIIDPLERDVLYYVDQFSDMNDITNYNIISRVELTNDIIQKMDRNYTAKTCFMLNLRLLSSFLDSLDMDNHPNHISLIGLIIKMMFKKIKFSSYFFSFLRFFYSKYCKSLPLHVEIIMGNSDLEIQTRLSKENINSKDDLGLTALHLAVATENIDAIKLLCEHKAEYSKDNVLGVYPHQLVRDDDYRSKEILKSINIAASIIKEEDNLRADIMTEDYVAQNLPLHDAVQKNDLDRVEKESAGLNDVDSRGRTILHVAAACHFKNNSMYRFLLRRNIIYARDKYGFYPDDYCINKIFNSESKAFKLHKYAIARRLTALRENKNNIFGKPVIDIIKEIAHELF